MMKFNGNFVLQTMFLKAPDFDSSSDEVLKGWMEIVRRLSPREIMVYTLDREAPMEGLEKFTKRTNGNFCRTFDRRRFLIYK